MKTGGFDTMNCCGNHNHDNNPGSGDHTASTKKHNWIMILGCVLPIVIFAAVVLYNAFITGSAGSGSTNSLLFLLLLLCPLSHFIMMPLMNKKKQKNHHH
ncbi:DUF2933 domain-containing protein [Paenibacillus lutimineralis]|uniref:DUF2933 domain-containing protein n=2 Tax=Paenibacillus lutimineralis TaxID=2707005 RepID=A0A3Q9I8U7_9BACL|nr:DUF2933 domain-containing protein [Paenibacillus lutimineralis]